jgi:hypothetical protein
LLVNSADRGSSAWYIGDPGTHGPTIDAPCEAPAACRDSRLDNAHVVPTLHRIYPDTCMFTKLGKGALLARARGPRLHGSKQNFV